MVVAGFSFSARQDIAAPSDVHRNNIDRAYLISAYRRRYLARGRRTTHGLRTKDRVLRGDFSGRAGLAPSRLFFECQRRTRAQPLGNGLPPEVLDKMRDCV